MSAQQPPPSPDGFYRDGYAPVAPPDSLPPPAPAGASPFPAWSPPVQLGRPVRELRWWHIALSILGGGVLGVGLTLLAMVVLAVAAMDAGEDASMLPDYQIAFRTTGEDVAIGYGLDGRVTKAEATGSWSSRQTAPYFNQAELTVMIDDAAPSSTTASCEIEVDGMVLARAEAAGPGASATCRAN